MLTKEDLGLIRDVVRSEIQEETGRLGRELREEMREMKVELRGEIAELGRELRQEMAIMKCDLRREMSEMETRIIDSVGEIIHEGILPQIDLLRSDIQKIRDGLLIAAT